jgi:thiosulfate reductase cytochrome b subunit
MLQQSQADDVPLLTDHHPTHNNNNSNNNNRLHQLASTQILVLSIALIVCGGIAIVTNAIALTITSNILIVLSAGFYCGAFVRVDLIGLFCTIC